MTGNFTKEDELRQTLPALLDRAARLYGDEPALITPHETLTFRDVQARSRALAKGLIAAGAGKGTRLALLMGNTVSIILSMCAGWRIGALVIPISTIATPAEFAHIIRHCDAQMLLAGRTYANRDYADLLARALPSLSEARDPRGLRLTEAPFLRSIWLDDPRDLAWAGSQADLFGLGESDAALSEPFLDEIESEVVPADDGVIIYTSGSTTQPKAVLHSQGGMFRQVTGLAEMQCYRYGQRSMSLGPLFWVGGLNMMLECFVTGGRIVLPDGVSTRAAVDAIRDLGVTRLSGWPAQFKAIREIMDAEGLDYSGVRGLGVARLPNGQIRQPDQVPNQLGMTETFGPHSGANIETILPDDRRGAFGPARGGFERRVADPATGEEVPPGQPGELWVRGPSLMKGLYKKERSEVFSPDGFYNTNDVVRIQPNDDMYFQGRTGDMLKTKGANVSRLEVEMALRSQPEVAEAVVCGLADQVLGQRVVAAVVPEPGQEIDVDDLKARLRAQIAAYKIPTDIVVIGRDDLIWSATGKIRLLEMGQLIATRAGLAA